MVREGIFTVELVNADTNAPFKEHTGPDGNVYAEVEPDMDYFIRVSVSDVKNGKGVLMRYTVDGESLGYSTRFYEPTTASKGIWERQGNGMEAMTALRFAKTDGPSQLGISVEPSFGSIVVTFKDLDLLEGRMTRGARGNPWVGGHTLVDAAISETTSKVVSSREGRKRTSQQQMTTPIRKCVEREELATIEIRYCTAVGLILVGVLPKPPGWESRDEKAQKPLSSSMKKCLAVEPSSIVVVPENAAWGQKEVRADCFDLVDADESDVEEEEFELIEKAQNLKL